MRIVQAIETSGPGGAERVFLCLCDLLRDQGHSVLAILLKPGWLRDQLMAQGTEVRVLPISSPIDRQLLAGLVGTLDEFGADVLHSHEFTMTLYGRAATRKLRLPQVATAHGKNFCGGAKRRLLGAALLRRRPRFRLVAVSRDLVGYLSGRLFIPASSVELVTNGIELPAPPQRAPRSGTLRCVAVGNLYPVKNHQMLVQAIARLQEDGVDATLHILGRGGEEAALRALIARLGVERRVFLEGFRPDVHEYLERADVLVSSSLSEGMPLSFLEAMSMGLPIVASRVGGVPEVVEDGREGLLFSLDDLDGLAALLKRIDSEPGLHASLRDAAMERAARDFSAARMVERYTELYLRLSRS